MKIIELVSENFKRLNAHVIMDGKSVTVEGKNGVGKSSFIDAIWIALTGKDAPEQPIKTGEDSANISLTVKDDNGESFVVERRFTKNGGTLTVKTLSGAKFSSPQKFLDEKIGKISFDPFDFVRKQPREQKKFLMELLGIDLTDIDQQKKDFLIKKQECTKKYVILQNELDNLSLQFGDEILEKKDEVESIKKYQECLKTIEEIKEKKYRFNFLVKNINEYSIKIKEMQENLKSMNEEFEKLKTENLEEPELSDIQSEIKSINEHNDRWRKQQSIIKQKKEKHEERLLEVEKAKELDRQIKDLEENRIEIISRAKMPINGLEFGEDGIFFEGLSFTEEQLSTAKLIEAGIKIQMALNPALRIMRIKDGSLLDSETLEIIKFAAKENDYQLFIERVSDSKEIGFIIEEE